MSISNAKHFGNTKFNEAVELNVIQPEKERKRSRLALIDRVIKAD